MGVSVHVESLSPENSTDYEIERKLCKRCASLCSSYAKDNVLMMMRGREKGKGVFKWVKVRATWISRGRVARVSEQRKGNSIMNILQGVFDLYL